MGSVFKAEIFAEKAHGSVNHLYDGQPYKVHLKLAVEAANRFINLIPINSRDSVLSGVWLHDTMEDARLTYNDIKKEFGMIVAEYVYALTNEKGRTRAERANDKYYSGIKAYNYATFIKLCDRIANISYSKQSGNRMFQMYKNEQPSFRSKLYDGRFDEMWDYIDELLK